MNKIKAIILDRDGVINKDHGYVCGWERFEYIDGVVETLIYLAQKKIDIYIVTNQSGIARKYFTENQYLTFQHSFLEDLKSKGVKIAGIEYCPHHPKGLDEKYKIECDCRKPKPGMINRILLNHSLLPSEVLFIGDKKTDIQAAEEARIYNNFIISNYKFDNSFTKSISSIKEIMYFI